MARRSNMLGRTISHSHSAPTRAQPTMTATASHFTPLLLMRSAIWNIASITNSMPAIFSTIFARKRIGCDRNSRTTRRTINTMNAVNTIPTTVSGLLMPIANPL